MNEEEKHKKYKPFSMRLNKKTIEKLKEARGGVSWNKFLLELLEIYEDNKPQ